MRGNSASMSQVPISVVCLVLQDKHGRVLATRRPHNKAQGGLWEFPGGKVETGETPEQALRREIREELKIKLGTLTPMDSSTYRYDFGQIVLIPFFQNSHAPELQLSEHLEARWLCADELQSVEWAPADLPVVAQVQARIA